MANNPHIRTIEGQGIDPPRQSGAATRTLSALDPHNPHGRRRNGAGAGDGLPALGRWTGEDALRALELAMETLRLLPLGARDRPARPRSLWPDIVRAAAEAYGYTEPVIAKAAPSAAEIDRADLVLGMVRRLPLHLMQVALARAVLPPVPWRRLCARTGRSRTTLDRWRTEAGARLAELVNASI